MTIQMNDLSSMDFSDVADYNAPRIPHIHAGQVLHDEFLQPLGISKYRLAKAIGVSAPRIGDIVAGRRGVSADTALRLARYFGTSADFWLNLQSGYDLETTAAVIASDLSHIQPLHA